MMIELSEIELARRRLIQAFASRSVQILPNSELWFVLEEMRRFSEASRDLKIAASASETDDSAVAVGLDLLRGWRLDRAVDVLLGADVPHVVQTLRTISSFKHGKPQHRLQFDQSEYELHMASQFHGHGQRISFVDTRRPSRYQQRVEFMVGYKFPIECKHPQFERRIIANIDAALGKLNERQQPGGICIGLEQALPMSSSPYLEVMNADDVKSQISEHVAPWFSCHRKLLVARLAQGYGRFIIFTYTALTYVHLPEAVALPSTRVALTATGEWVEENVVSRCIGQLKRERKQQRRSTDTV
jgi:hypothetical protein